MIKKIIKIKNFGSFKNYIADDKLNEFKKYNLFWGLNGTGKTTLSTLFRCLNEGCIPQDLDQNSFKENFDIVLDDEQHITHLENNSYFNKVKIFNRDFVFKNLTLDNENAQTHAITYTIGEIAKDIKNKISELNIKLSMYYEEVNGKKELIVQNNYNKIQQELNDLYKDAAEKIRFDLLIKNGPEFNINHFKQNYEKFLNNKNIISEKEKNESAKKYIQPVKNKIAQINFETMTDTQIIMIKEILSKEIKRANIKEELVQWLEKGLDYKNDDICPFCHKPLYDYEERYNEIQNIVKKDDKYIEYENNIKQIFEKINSLTSLIKQIHFTLRLDDFSCNITQSEIDDYKDNYEKYKNYIEYISKIIQKKINNPDQIYYLDNDSILAKYIKSREKINKLITEHNYNIDNVNSIKTEAKNNVIFYYIQQEKESIEYYKKKLNEYSEQVNNTKKEIERIQKEITNLNDELTNQKAPISEIEKYLYIVFGHKKFSLEYDEMSKSYNICR
ncbi:AAA family ATPase, partial [bacterium]|nr:AAA family ATPase [bacterium]